MTEYLGSARARDARFCELLKVLANNAARDKHFDSETQSMAIVLFESMRRGMQSRGCTFDDMHHAVSECVPRRDHWLPDEATPAERPLAMRPKKPWWRIW